MSRYTDRFVQREGLITLTDADKRKIREIKGTVENITKADCKIILQRERQRNRKLDRVWRANENDKYKDMYDVAKRVYTDEREKPPLFQDFNAACRSLMTNQIQWKDFQFKGLFVALYYSFYDGDDAVRATVVRGVTTAMTPGRKLISFHQFASTSRKSEVAENFLDPTGMQKGTMFLIRDAEGLDMKKIFIFLRRAGDPTSSI